MPIKGLSDRGLSFPIVGHIRKGGPKTGEGESTRIGKDLEFFRVEFDEGESELVEKFRRIYGEQPRSLRVVLPFNEIDRFFDCWQEAYLAGAMIHRCDGERVQWARDPETGEILVKDWKGPGGQEVLCSGGPVAFYTTGQGKKKSVKCDRVGRLKVILPELGRLACLVVHTGSALDVVNLNGQLEWYKWLANGKLTGLTFQLKRKPSMVSTPTPEGKRVRRKKWLLHLEADPEWVSEMLKNLKTSVLPGLAEITPPEIEIVEDRALEGDWEEFSESDTPEEPEAPTAPLPTQPSSEPEPEPETRVVGFIQSPNAWRKLLDLATTRGWYKQGERGAGNRMQHVLKGAGMKQFELSSWDEAVRILDEHYSRKEEENG